MIFTYTEVKFTPPRIMSYKCNDKANYGRYIRINDKYAGSYYFGGTEENFNKVKYFLDEVWYYYFNCDERVTKNLEFCFNYEEYDHWITGGLYCHEKGQVLYLIFSYTHFYNYYKLKIKKQYNKITKKL